MSLHTRSSKDTFFSGEYIFLIFRNFWRILSMAAASGSTAPSTPSSWGLLVFARARFSFSCCQAPLLTCRYLELKSTVFYPDQRNQEIIKTVFQLLLCSIVCVFWIHCIPGNHVISPGLHSWVALGHFCAWPSQALGLYKITETQEKSDTENFQLLNHNTR